MEEVLLTATCVCGETFDVWAERVNGEWSVDRELLRCPECLQFPTELREKEGLG